MKKLLVVSMAAVLVMSMNQAYGRGHGRQDGKGPQMRCVKRVLRDAGMAQKLGLTEEQVSSLEALNYTFSKQVIALRSAQELAELELEQVMQAESVDRVAVMNALDVLGAAKLAVRKAELGAWLDAKDVFTPEQMEQLKKVMRSQGKGRGGKGRSGSKGKKGKGNRGKGRNQGQGRFQPLDAEDEVPAME